MSRQQFILGIAAIAASVSCHSSFGGIIQYSANANPTSVDGYLTEAGTQNWAASIAGPATGVGINDGGTPAWEINNSADAGTEEFYTMFPTPADLTAGSTLGWKLSANVRVPTSNMGATAAMTVSFGDATTRWAMDLGSDADGDPRVRLNWGGGGPLYTLEGAGSGSYHLFELVYNPVSDNADLFIDGVERISDWAGEAAGNFDLSRVVFGDRVSNAGHARYNLVRWESVPEPGTGLVAIGSIMLFSMRRRMS